MEDGSGASWHIAGSPADVVQRMSADGIWHVTRSIRVGRTWIIDCATDGDSRTIPVSIDADPSGTTIQAVGLTTSDGNGSATVGQGVGTFPPAPPGATTPDATRDFVPARANMTRSAEGDRLVVVTVTWAAPFDAAAERYRAAVRRADAGFIEIRSSTGFVLRWDRGSLTVVVVDPVELAIMVDP